MKAKLYPRPSPFTFFSFTATKDVLSSISKVKGKRFEKMLSKQEAKISVNSSPNLFRLSLPEWLKEQVDSGKHKGVYWINEKERIFHVPWKHASRNGWEDDDVSLFRAWAIYTNRYRVEVDKPRPALWKTNFRCAINSHNSISFLKDQGQRKGDKAHRIMKILDPPKKNRSRMHISPDSATEPPRKMVRLTYPNFGVGATAQQVPTSQQLQVQRGQIISTILASTGYSASKGGESCDSCNELKARLRFILEHAFKDQENLENNADYLALKSKYIECISTKDHVCTDTPLTDLVNNIIPASAIIPNQDVKPKPNLQDLYYIGKALQQSSGNDMSTTATETTVSANVEVKTEGTLIQVLETSCTSAVTQEVEVQTEDGEAAVIEQNDLVEPVETAKVEEEVVDENDNGEEDEEEEEDEEVETDVKGEDSDTEVKEEDSFFDGKEIEHVEISEEEDDLITPRNT